jgi:demethylmenaquinone methyltransferase/2-methoxy-6-polyprenyl-1,4-benzoquinol methylase
MFTNLVTQMAQSQTNNPLPTPQQKHAYVQDMFDAIAPRYDLLNSVLSMRLHHAWRDATVKALALSNGSSALDICTGTGDLAFALSGACGPAGVVDASDFSEGMLSIARTKVTPRGGAPVTFQQADAQKLPYAGNTYDAVTVAFGMRNVANITAGISEMVRVAKPGGRVAILEFNQPTKAWFRVLYRLYSFHILPVIGGLISGRKSAYAYLPASVDAWPDRETLTAHLQTAGCKSVSVTDFLFGAVALHIGVKR